MLIRPKIQRKKKEKRKSKYTNLLSILGSLFTKNNLEYLTLRSIKESLIEKSQHLKHVLEKCLQKTKLKNKKDALIERYHLLRCTNEKCKSRWRMQSMLVEQEVSTSLQGL